MEINQIRIGRIGTCGSHNNCNIISLVLFYFSLMMSVIVSRLTLGNEKKIRTQEGSDECMVFIPSPPR